MKYYNWDTDGKGHMWSYETPDGAWVSRTAAEDRISELETALGIRNPQMVAALFVQTDGAYFGLPNVDPWDEARDARKYDGPDPVVAHPPCSRWCKPLAKVNQTRYGHKIGDDGGCFDSALNAVVKFGGVLEHPANSYAWDKYDLQKPIRGAWLKDSSFTFLRVWVTEVSQSAYGHPARKNTWLLYCGKNPPPTLDWSDPKGTHLTSWLQRTSRVAPRLSKKEAIKTPDAFRDMLLLLARDYS